MSSFYVSFVFTSSYSLQCTTNSPQFIRFRNTFSGTFKRKINISKIVRWQCLHYALEKNEARAVSLPVSNFDLTTYCKSSKRFAVLQIEFLMF
ncbi:unnamed protein product [Ixodes persulcatus]